MGVATSIWEQALPGAVDDFAFGVVTIIFFFYRTIVWPSLVDTGITKLTRISLAETFHHDSLRQAKPASL
jgi:hypothetical protein